MLDKSKTFTVAELLKMLADGRVTPDMPLAVWDGEGEICRGLVALDIQTFKDGAKALTFFPGERCAKGEHIEASSEVFP